MWSVGGFFGPKALNALGKMSETIRIAVALRTFFNIAPSAHNREEKRKGMPGMPAIVPCLYPGLTMDGKPVDSGSICSTIRKSDRSIFRGSCWGKPLGGAQLLLGLIGQRNLISYEKDTDKVDKEVTFINLSYHVDGEICGISTSKSWLVGLSFANFLIPEEKVVIAIDSHNIPDELKLDTSTAITPPSLKDKDDEIPLNLPHVRQFSFEKEVTVPDVPPWSIFGVLSRNKKTLYFHWNPFYIDKTALENYPELKLKFDDLEKKYYKACRDMRMDSYAPSVVKTSELIRQFYEEYIQKTGMHEGQRKDILKAMDAQDALASEYYGPFRPKIG